MTQAEDNQGEVIDMNRIHQNRRAKLREILRARKHQLQVALASRTSDVEEVKLALEAEIQKAQAELEAVRQRNCEDVSALREALSARQRELDAEKAANFTAYEATRERELERLKREHQARVAEIIFQVERMLSTESEKYYSLGAAEAQNQHHQETALVKTRIAEFRSQVMACELAITELREGHAWKMRAFEDTRRIEIAERKRTMKEEFDADRKAFLSQQRELRTEMKGM